MAQKCGNCQKNWIAKRIHPPTLNSSVPATQPIRQGKAPGIPPISTAMECFFFSGVYTKAYRKRLKAEIPADSQLKKYPIITTPTAPAIRAKVQPSSTLIRPEATGLLAVRFIRASVSFSTTWLMALADPVISIPAAKSKRTCGQ